MKTYVIAASAAAMLLLAGPAQANHCDLDIAEVESALASPTTAEPNKLDAAEALFDDAVTACAREEHLIAEADPGSPLLDPDYVTVGQSMLINAKQLTQGN